MPMRNMLQSLCRLNIMMVNKDEINYPSITILISKDISKVYQRSIRVSPIE